MLGQKLGHYRILEKIGDGGMSVVYRAHDERLDRDVALKVLHEGSFADEASRNRIRHEALSLSKLNHANIATIYDFDAQEGRDFLVMEFIPGKTLAQRLVNGPLSEKEVITQGLQIAAALEEAHEKRVLHRDLKPGNIMVTSGGQAKVLDFGLAKALRPRSETTTETLSDAAALAGTLPYMAPEQLRGEQTDRGSDIYALGAVLYEMATGRKAFYRESAPCLIEAILHEPPLPPRSINPRISGELERVILKCLDKEPENRYQSAKELGVDLRRLGIPHTSSNIVLRGPARVRWQLASTLGLALLLVLATLIALNVGGWRSRLRGARSSPHINSLAVLPLANLSGNTEQEYFADGVTEELINALSRIGTLRVISRTSVMRYKGAHRPLPEIASELKVDGVVEGTVQHSDRGVRISVGLVDARSDRNLWGQSYEEDLRDVLSLQSKVARAIAGEIQVQLTPQESASLSKKRPVNPEAYDTYLRARYLWNKRTPENLRKALNEFKKATDLDPTSALLWGGLADGYSLLAYYDEQPPREVMPLAKAAAKKALQLDDSLAESHTSLANIEWAYDWDSQLAETEFERALVLNPNYATAHEWHGFYLREVGRFDEAIAEMRRAQDLDPLSPVIELNVGRSYYYARRYVEAVELLLTLEQREPDFWIVHAILGQTYLAMGRLDDAIRELERSRALSPSSLRNWGVLGDAYGRTGRRGQALKLAEELWKFSRRRYVPPVYSAMIYMGLGDKPRALAFLEKAYADRSDWIMQLKVEPEFDLLRDNPHFLELLRHADQEAERGRQP